MSRPLDGIAGHPLSHMQTLCLLLPHGLTMHPISPQILLKREDLQPVFSFKLRGAYNKMAKLPKELLEK